MSIYDLQSWISEIGGTIGLTLGISGLSLVEVVSDARLGAEMFGMGDFWLEIRVIIKISSHPWYPINFVTDLNRDEAKKKWPTQKTEIFNSANSQYFFAKISGIGPWVNKRVGWIFDLCRVEFFKIGKRDVTFIREMRVVG